MIGLPFARRGSAAGGGGGGGEAETAQAAACAVKAALDRRAIVLIGLMGCGKSAIGKRLAARLDLPFVDADEEIERAANMSITEIFARHGEPHFRDREEKVIARLLTQGAQVLATGGGAYMSASTRAAVAAHGVAVWLRADLPILMRRVARRDNRPLLAGPDPEAVMRRLMAERYPVYGEAPVAVESRDVPHDQIVDEIIAALTGHLGIQVPTA
ncbi:MAG: shikimate kinase [Hyphomicrobiaceae bacterium]|nr:shikimate kinase [Hyphomicrobiaceae bacterium]